MTMPKVTRANWFALAIAGGAPITQFRRLGQNERSVAVAIVGPRGSAVNDRVMLCYGDGDDKPVTLAGDGESFTFTGHLYVRVGRDAVEVCGHPQAIKVRVAGKPELVINGEQEKATLGTQYSVLSWKLTGKRTP